MSRPAKPTGVCIDARVRGPDGPLAIVPLLGRPLVHHLLDAAATLALEQEPIAIHARLDEHQDIQQALAGRERPPCVLCTGPPREGSLILRADRLYDPARLRRAALRGKDIETAAIWRLDGPHGLAGAEAELARRQTYQPLGKYWALTPARLLARLLVPTRIRPNSLTLTACFLMLVASGLVAWSKDAATCRYLASLALALALVLDTADGHLARLQGTSTNFGRWLDAVLDELSDIALHGAIAWSLFSQSDQPAWLLLGFIYVSGKHVFDMANTEWQTIQAPQLASASATCGTSKAASFATRIVRALGHADFRWHLWIALAALGRLDAALIAYSFYYPARALLGAASKWRV